MSVCVCLCATFRSAEGADGLTRDVRYFTKDVRVRNVRHGGPVLRCHSHAFRERACAANDVPPLTIVEANMQCLLCKVYVVYLCNVYINTLARGVTLIRLRAVKLRRRSESMSHSRMRQMFVPVV